MKSIKFRPLRMNKSTGKIIVASYMQWRKVKTADYNKFSLTIDDEYRRLPANQFVYNHTGQQLFFYPYCPDEVPVFHAAVANLEQIQGDNSRYGIRWSTGYVNYASEGVDIDGVPCFSHITANYIASDDTLDVTRFEPLTVGMVAKWFGWFLYQLENSHLKVGR